MSASYGWWWRWLEDGKPTPQIQNIRTYYLWNYWLKAYIRLNILWGLRFCFSYNTESLLSFIMIVHNNVDMKQTDCKMFIQQRWDEQSVALWSMQPWRAKWKFPGDEGRRTLLQSGKEVGRAVGKKQAFHVESFAGRREVFLLLLGFCSYDRLWELCFRSPKSI